MPIMRCIPRWRFTMRWINADDETGPVKGLFR